MWQIETRRVRRTLQVFESLLGGREWLIGQSISVADLALAHHAFQDAVAKKR